MTEYIGIIANCMSSNNCSGSVTEILYHNCEITAAVRSEVDLLKKEMAQNMNETKNMIIGINSVLQELVKTESKTRN